MELTNDQVYKKQNNFIDLSIFLHSFFLFFFLFTYVYIFLLIYSKNKILSLEQHKDIWGVIRDSM
jgi:hypothetical protein